MTGSGIDINNLVGKDFNFEDEVAIIENDESLSLQNREMMDQSHDDIISELGEQPSINVSGIQLQRLND